MDPVLALPWQEYFFAEELEKKFKKADGFSILAPLSRQEKGIDLVLLKKVPHGKSKVVTFQLKASRVFNSEPPKRKTTRRYLYGTWFNAFVPDPNADFFILTAVFAAVDPVGKVGRGKGAANKFHRIFLVFSFDEMRCLMQNCKQVNGKPDKQFSFGFDDPNHIFITRGRQDRVHVDFADHLLVNRLPSILEKFK